MRLEFTLDRVIVTIVPNIARRSEDDATRALRELRRMKSAYFFLQMQGAKPCRAPWRLCAGSRGGYVPPRPLACRLEATGLCSDGNAYPAHREGRD